MKSRYNAQARSAAFEADRRAQVKSEDVATDIKIGARIVLAILAAAVLATIKVYWR